MKKPEFILLILLEIIAGLAYHVWISFALFIYGDGTFFFKESMRDAVFPTAWGPHGGPVFWQYPFLLLYGIFGYLGFDSNVAEKFLVFGLIIFVAPVASFLLVKKITNSNIAGFIGSLIFSYNTYFLSIDTQSHELLTVAFIWGTLALLSFIHLIEDKKKIFIPLTSLLLFIVGFYDLRSLYVVVGVAFLYFVYHQLFIERKWNTVIKWKVLGFTTVFIFLGLLNVYWLLPVISANALTNNEYLARGIFGSQYYSIQSSLAFFYPYWTGKETTWLYLQKIPLYFWIYPLLAFSGFIVARKNKKIAFFGLLAIIGIFLTKQEGQPFSFVYDWLYAYIPGFSAFREASKFDFITAISYAVLIGVFADFIWNYFKDRKIKYLFIFLIALLPLWNTKPLITGEIKTMFVPISLSSDFVKLKNYILQDGSYSRVMGISLNRHYVFATNDHPERDFLNALHDFWGADIVSYNFDDKTLPEGEKLMKYLGSEEGRRILSESSVGYIPVFIEDKPTFQSIRRDLGKNADYFKQEMDKISYLKRIDLGMKNIILYKDTDYKPHLYLTTEPESLKKEISYKKAEYQMINPSEYRISFKDLKESIYLNLTELNDPNWKIRIGNFSWWKILLNKSYFSSQVIHSQSAIRFNQFLIDPNTICRVSACSVNPDGSASFEATLYYFPQSYLYLGLIISGTVFVFVIGSVFYFLKKEKNEKK